MIGAVGRAGISRLLVNIIQFSGLRVLHGSHHQRAAMRRIIGNQADTLLGKFFLHAVHRFAKTRDEALIRSQVFRRQLGGIGISRHVQDHVYIGKMIAVSARAHAQKRQHSGKQNQTDFFHHSMPPTDCRTFHLI